MIVPRMLFVVVMVGAALFGGLISAAVVGSPISASSVQNANPITTTQINIVDGNGQLRAVLSGSDERRMTSLSFYDTSGQQRVMVGIDETSTPLFRLLDSSGNSRVSAISISSG